MTRAAGVRAACTIILASIACAASSLAQQMTKLPAFVPSRIPAGVIRSWGDDSMGGIMTVLEDGFRRYHPDVTFQSTLDGSGTGMAGIITGASDLSLMGRSATANEIMGFEWVFRYKPLGIQVMTGNLKQDGKSPALAVFVSNTNPLRTINVAGLAAILECPCHAGSPVTWVMAGAKGAWASKPVHAYLYDSETGTGAFLQQTLLGSKDRWNWSVVREFKDKRRSNGTTNSAGQQTVRALKNDPDGIAVSTLGHAEPWARTLALSVTGPPVLPASEALVTGSYPLARGVYIYINRRPGQPVDSRVAEFLRFVLSAEGQRLVARQGDFLPINEAIDSEQSRKLE